MKDLSRRDFLSAMGLLGAGVLLNGLYNLGEASPAQAKIKATKWPWPYVKLDPEKTAELAYNEWYRIFCGGAVISSIFSQLAEKVGEPYASFPVDAFIILEGGMAGWGTICGTVNAAAIVANLICGPRISGSEAGHIIASNIMDWYSNTALPNYIPKKPKANKDYIIQTTSGSPLCHISVGKWMTESGFSLGSPERKDRCARLAASTAYQLVLILNEWKDGHVEDNVRWAPGPSYGITGQQNCYECHGQKGIKKFAKK